VVFFVPKFAGSSQLEREGAADSTVASSITRSASTALLAAGLLGSAHSCAKARTPQGRLFVDRLKLRLPIVGGIFLGSATSRFCRVLGTLLRNGVPLLRALEISRDSTGNHVLAEAIRESAENVTSGDTLSKPLARCGLLAPPVMAMIRVAEESNNLENVLINIADGIDRKTSRQLDIMVRLVEP
jgi:general secretion pathway protein F/type IV pilus assembly protein PilC